jgi:predicted Zn-dependent peptidase
LIRTTLPNGLRVVAVQRPHAPVIALKLFMKVGSRHDGERPGISHFVEHLMLDRPALDHSLHSGSGHARAQTAAEEVESLGGEVNAVTHREYTALQAVAPPEHTTHLLRVFRGLVEPLELAADRVDREREVIAQEIETHADTHSAAWELFVRALWGDADPFARPIFGEPGTIRGVTAGELAGHFSRYVVPGRMVLAAAGPLEPDGLVEAAAAALGDLAGPRWEDDFGPVRAGPRRSRMVKETRAAHLIVGVDAVPIGDSRRPAVKVLDMLLGGGAASRLHQGLRSRRGLVYDVSTAAMAFEDRGYLCAYTSCLPSNVGRALEAVLEEFERLASEPVRDAELAAARTRYEGMLARRFETALAAAGIIGIEELLGGSETFELAAARVAEVGADDARRVAAELFDLDRVAIALVGPPGTLET